MRYLRLSEILYLHGRIIEKSGGISGIRNLGWLESAIALPKQFFSGTELYPSLIEKAAVFCFSIVANHQFIDGNKRVGHASMETDRVTEAADGLEVLERFTGQPSDVVISEPQMNGLKLAARLKELSPETPVILCTAFIETSFFPALVSIMSTHYDQLYPFCTPTFGITDS